MPDIHSGPGLGAVGQKVDLRYKDVLPLLDYFTINIYPFLSCGVRGVAMENLTGPDMNFLNDQISALRSLAWTAQRTPSGGI